MYRKVFIVLVATVLIFALGIQVGTSQEKETIDATRIVRKLDEVLANQAEMLKQVEEIKQELAIIKVRASR